MGRCGDVELDDIELTGDRLVLRRWTPGDAGRVHEIMQDPRMVEYLAVPQPYTRGHAEEFVGSTGHEGRSTGTGLGCAVVERTTGRLVGSAALRLAGDDPDIGYWVSPDAQGRGYAAEATRMLATWGFGTLGLQRVALRCDVANVASVRTAMAAGFRYEGTRRNGASSRRAPGRADLALFGRAHDDPGLPFRPVIAPLPPGGLTDGVVRLRLLAPGDGPDLCATEDEVAVGWGFSGVPTDPDECRHVVDRAGLEWLVTGPARMAILDEASGAFAGELTVRLAGPPQVGGIGYGVHPAFRGRAYTTRALRLLVPWAFGPADFARLELGAKSANVASQRAAASAGFEPDGTRATRLRNPDGTFSDEVRYALTNPHYA